MMYLEYDWTSMVYRPRFGDTFIDVRGWRSFDCKREAVDVLDTCGLVLGKKTDSRTWEIVAKDVEELERPGGCGAARNPVLQAITTRYLGPTDYKGSRIKARSAGASLTVHYDDALNTEDNHREAAEALIAKLDWAKLGGVWHQGGMPDDSGYCFVCVPD